MRQEANFYSLDEPQIALAQVWKYRREQQAHIEQRITVEQGRAETTPGSTVAPCCSTAFGLPPPPTAPIPPRQEQPEQMPKSGNSRAKTQQTCCASSAS